MDWTEVVWYIWLGYLTFLFLIIVKCLIFDRPKKINKINKIK